MRKITLLLFMVVGYFSVSCSSDDDSSDDQASILGKWVLTEIDESTLDYWGECAVGNATYDFDETTIVSTHYFGNNCQSTGVRYWNYSISGKVLTKTEVNGGYEAGTDYVIKYNILKLDKTSLEVEEIYVDEGYNGEDGYNVPPNERTTEYWNKIE